MARQEKKNTGKKRDRIGYVLYGSYLFLLLMSVILIGKLIDIQFIWEPQEKIENALRPRVTRHSLEPIRGSIYDRNGRLLAQSYPVYDLHLDCTVGEDAHWMEEAKALSEGLAAYFPPRSADRHFRDLKNAREKGRKYYPLGKVDRKTLLKIRQLPLIREGRNRGGLIEEPENVRRYPYGKLARRTIGFVRDNKPGVTNNKVGIEGKYDALLHGTDGVEWMRITDKGVRVRDFDSTYMEAVNGRDLNLTIDIDWQEVADRSLRNLICEEPDLDAACLVLMEVKTGAIRTMVNLKRDIKSGRFEEIENIAIGRRHEPGSVFKTVTLMSVLSDGHIRSLEKRIPTNKGLIPGARVNDEHIREFEMHHHKNSISVLEGFRISSNYVFAHLAIDYYGNCRDSLVSKIHKYKLAEKFDFDLEGLQTPNVPRPRSNIELARMGYGYATEETPLHILTYYNAIAGKGRMMKPYLIETGTPYVLDQSICTEAVADTLIRALMSVTEEGTARRLKDAACNVAGKTGTSFGTYPKEQKGADPYTDKAGRRKYQGSFVGFFPAEDPKYSVICSIYSKPTKTSFQGGRIPAMAVKELVDYLAKTDPELAAFNKK